MMAGETFGNFWTVGTILFFTLVYLLPVLYISWVLGRQRRIGFFWSLIVCLVTSPLFGFFIVSSSGLKNAKGCGWCGNTYNEAEFCGLCGKNEEGELRPGFIPRKK